MQKCQTCRPSGSLWKKPWFCPLRGCHSWLCIFIKVKNSPLVFSSMFIHYYSINIITIQAEPLNHQNTNCRVRLTLHTSQLLSGSSTADSFFSKQVYFFHSKNHARALLCSYCNLEPPPKRWQRNPSASVLQQQLQPQIMSAIKEEGACGYH